MDDKGRSERLIAGIVSGKADDFEAIIQDYQRLVSHMVFRMVDNSADREDLCQEVFVKVYRNLGSFQAKSKLSTWIARIAYNTCINYLEKKRVPLYGDMSAEEKGIDDEPGNLISPLESAGRAEVGSIVRKAINQLPPQYRTVVTLFHLEQMNYQEISQVMELPEGTLKSHLFRARKLLKSRLSARYCQEDLCH